MYSFKHHFQLIKNYIWHLPKNIFWRLYYNNPSQKLILIGVTGTDGKTTTSNLIHNCLQSAGYNAGIISTIGCYYGSKTINTGLHTTSPDPRFLQKLLNDMVKEGVTHCVVEVTAHAINQFRTQGLKFQISVITNITHEHLDDFPSLDYYASTKLKIARQSKYLAINNDDLLITKHSSTLNHTPITFAINHSADYKATDVTLDHTKLTFNVGHTKFVTNSNYKYQVYNILATIAVISNLKLPISIVQKTIKNYPELNGRRQVVPNNHKVKTIIDFAHTPSALKETISSLKKIAKGRVIVIFGATGGRDQSKRPLMGKVVSEIADIGIVTSDDTRHEDIETINSQIISGMKPDFIYHNIPNRQEAFNLAVSLSKPGDTIIACGKGHETTILLGNTEYPWSEAEAFRTAFRLKENQK